ncbi:MAG: cytochrome c oxidase assembly protein subunit 15 [Kiritimatiellia bacterium]|jgi:cytochrome c oxidase assembly protein subunit 15
MLFRSEKIDNTLFRLTIAAFILTIFVVVLGAFTRLVDAGLGCPDWPGCYGHLLWPDEAHEIIKAQQAFPHAPVETDKTWPEMVHRYFAGSLGLFILAIAVIAIKRSTETLTDLGKRIPLKLPIFLLALVILQATFGMWTVTLKLWPKIVTAHLMGGFATLSLLWLLGQRLGGQHWHLSTAALLRLQKLTPLLLISLVVVIIQIMLGGWVSANYAALACPDVPQCFGQWLPPMDIVTGFAVFQDIGPNYLGGQLDNFSRIAIHVVHRGGAVVVCVTLLITGILLWRIGSTFIKQWVIALWLVLLLQISLGVSNIVFALPLSVAVAHNAVGALLLLVMVSICYRAFCVKPLV